MRSISFRAMTAAIIVIAVICATGLVSAQPFPTQGTDLQQPTTVQPTQSPTMQPTQGQQNNSADAGMQVSSGPGDKGFPAISGNSIVWLNNESLLVQFYDTASGNVSTISDATSIPFVTPDQLAIDGNNVVWTGVNQQTREVNIYLYDTASGRLQPVTNGSGLPWNPDTSQNYVIWTSFSNESGDVFLYDIASESMMPVATSPGILGWTDIGGNTTAWVSNETETGSLGIVVGSLGESGRNLVDTSGDDVYPDVSSDGQRIVWVGFLGNQAAVFLYDMATANVTQITGASAFPETVAVDGNLVVYSDLRNGNPDIYLYDISTGMETQITQDSYAQAFPDISNGEIVWMGNSTGQWEIYRASVGGGQQGPTPTQTGVMPTPTQTGVMPTPTQTGVMPTPTQTGVMPTPTQTGMMPTPTGTQSTDSGGAPVITAADINSLQWERYPSAPGYLIAEDSARGLTFYMDQNSPDVIVIQTASGAMYSYSISTGLMVQYDP